MTELELLKKPEYIHVVLNHLPIYGTIMGALSLAISLILRSRAAQITALILTLIAGASAYPVFLTGQRAYKTIRNQSDDAGADWWDQSGPVSGDQQGQQMQNMPGMQMPQQQPSPTPTPQRHQTDQMPGMKMPREQTQPSPTPNN